MLALLRETKSRFLDRGIRLGDVLAFGAESDAGGWKYLGRSCHRKDNRRGVERKQLPLIAAAVHPALRSSGTLGNGSCCQYQHASSHLLFPQNTHGQGKKT